MELEDRYTGCLLGLAAGDALGAPLGFMGASQIQIRHGTVREMIGGGWLGLRPGQHTEDTAMAVLLAESLVERRGFDRDDVARRYEEWFAAAPRRVRDDRPDGNGTVMRCAPLALWFGERRTELMEAAAEEARITHPGDEAAGGSAALTVMLSLILDGVEREDLFDRTWDILEENPLGLPNILPDIPEKEPGDLRPSPFVVDTLEVAIYRFLEGPDFEETVVSTANLGGDANTTAAVAGALAGTFWGAGAIPRRWLRALQDRTAIRGLARELFRVRPSPGPA